MVPISGILKSPPSESKTSSIADNAQPPSLHIPPNDDAIGLIKLFDCGDGKIGALQLMLLPAARHIASSSVTLRRCNKWVDDGAEFFHANVHFMGI